LQIEMLFDPEVNFRAPRVALQGNQIETVEVTALEKSRTRAAHRVEISVPLSKVSCPEWNKIDVTFLPEPLFSPARHALVTKVELAPHAPTPARLAQRFP
jgi:hypothetical protein